MPRFLVSVAEPVQPPQLWGAIRGGLYRYVEVESHAGRRDLMNSAGAEMVRLTVSAKRTPSINSRRNAFMNCGSRDRSPTNLAWCDLTNPRPPNREEYTTTDRPQPVRQRRPHHRIPQINPLRHLPLRPPFGRRIQHRLHRAGPQGLPHARPGHQPDRRNLLAVPPTRRSGPAVRLRKSAVDDDEVGGQVPEDVRRGEHLCECMVCPPLKSSSPSLRDTFAPSFHDII